MTTETTTTRGPAARYYVQADGTVLRRVKDEPDQTFSLDDLDSTTTRRLAVEGFIACHIKGMAATTILDGSTLPDRAVPQMRVKAAKERGPSMIVRAVAAAKAAGIVKAKRAGGEKITKDVTAEADAQALAWAKTLTEEQIKAAQKSAAVQIELAKLRGSSDALDDLVSLPVPPAEDAPADSAPVEYAAAAE